MRCLESSNRHPTRHLDLPHRANSNAAESYECRLLAPCTDGPVAPAGIDTLRRVERLGEGITSLLGELRARPGSLLLIVGNGSDTLADTIAQAWVTPVVSAGARVADAIDAGSNPSAWRLVEGAWVLKDIEVLFWAPAFHADVISVLRAGARRHPLAVVWPGPIAKGIARYSVPGRHDYYEGALGADLVLRTERDWYPGEVTFKREWQGA